MKKLFHICTIANKLDQYKEMKMSFIKAGFSEDLCRYSLFDNSKGNIYDPYQVLNDIYELTAEPYIIYCHQDVLLDQGDGYSVLVNLLQDLEAIAPQWANRR